MTAQVSERLIYGGREFALFSNPLSLYLQQTGTSFESPNTACWRGYVGTWEIIEAAGAERLYLVKLRAHKTYVDIVELKDIFPGYEKIFAHWFSGELRCPQGELLNYVHSGYASAYESDLFIQIERGVITGKHVEQNKPPTKKNEDDYPPFLKRSNA